MYNKITKQKRDTLRILMDSFFTPYCPPAHARFQQSGPTPAQLANHARAIQVVQGNQFPVHVQHTHHMQRVEEVIIVQKKVLCMTPFGIAEKVVHVPVTRVYYI